MEASVGDERFDRYYRRIQLALRLMSHGARAQTTSDWSWLTLDQLVTLRERWMPEADEGLRGPAPSSFQPFFRSATKASHAALFVSIHHIVGLNSTTPCLEGGERLCEAIEIYRAWEPEGVLQFDQGVLLAMGAMRGEEIELTNCAACGCALLVDRLNIPRLRCTRCQH